MLTEKYEWDVETAREFADFLHPMLAFDPNQRATAAECLQHPWLTGVPLDGQQQQLQAERRKCMAFVSQPVDEGDLDDEVCATFLFFSFIFLLIFPFFLSIQDDEEDQEEEDQEEEEDENDEIEDEVGLESPRHVSSS